jgi:hypothetical protein
MSEASFYEILERIDWDLADAARGAGCGCGGVLHRATYPRKPRGGPRDLGLGYERRLSFCCARQGCRKRRTPASVRFLGRRVYLGAVVVLVTALHHGVTGRRAARLRELAGVSVRTFKRWRRWWQEGFVASRFWQAARGRFGTPVAGERLPQSLLERFAGDARDRLVAALGFLSPITTGSAPGAMAF